MTPQLTHNAAAYTLRNLVTEQGNQETLTPEELTLEKYVERGIENIFHDVAEMYSNSPTTTPEEIGGVT